MYEMLQHDFIRDALCACLLVGGVCAFLSVYIVFRKIVFVGITLAQMSTAGVGIALLVGVNPTLGAMTCSLATVLALATTAFRAKVPGEATIGATYVAAAAATVLILALNPLDHGQILDIMFGNVLTVTRPYVCFMAAVFMAIVAVHYIFHRQFLFTTFDPEGACAFGYSGALWELLFYLLMGIVISLSIKAVGTLLCFGFLVVPAVTGLLAGKRLIGIFSIAISSALISGVIGMYISYRADLPTGPTVCAVLVILSLAAWVVSQMRR